MHVLYIPSVPTGVAAVPRLETRALGAWSSGGSSPALPLPCFPAPHKQQGPLPTGLWAVAQGGLCLLDPGSECAGNSDGNRRAEEPLTPWGQRPRLPPRLLCSLGVFGQASLSQEADAPSAAVDRVKRSRV